MLDYAIFAATFVIFLIIAVIYLYPGAKKSTTIPGPDPVDPLEGNIPDITACESLHEFLSKIHEDYGNIASFWYGPKMCVSIASPQLLEEQSAVFDRPYDLYKGLTLLLGDETVLLATGADGRRRHALYSKCFTQPFVSKKFQIYSKLAKKMVDRWTSCPKDEYIPLSSHMYDCCIKSFLQSEFGMENVSDTLIKTIKASFDVCWFDTEKFLIGDWMETGSSREKRFEEKKASLMKVVQDAIKRRQEAASGEAQKLLIDVIMELDIPEPAKLSDLLTFFLLGFHKTALVLTWAIYFLASNKDVQEKVHAEALKFLPKGDEITADILAKFKYLNQVIQETIRLSTVMPYDARIQDFDTMLGGHKIPSGTPIVHALGVIMNDETIFPLPDSFDPERFDDDKKKQIPALAFEPFGFAGKRKCPGNQLVFAESVILLAHLISTFRIDLAPDQVAIHEYGFVTKPKDEVWVTASAFKKE